MNDEIKMVKVRVPATSANLGPGFDTLGLALQLYLNVSIAASKSGIEISLSGLGADEIRANQTDNLVLKAMNHIFDKAATRPTGIKISIDNNIPVSKGLGSSAAAIVAGMYAANTLIGNRYSSEDLIKFAVEMEGHPDNIVPAVMGGLTTAMVYNGEIYKQQLNLGDQLGAVIVIPDFNLSTWKSRSVLPKTVSLQDAVYNMQRACFLIAAIQNGAFEHINKAMDDIIYQPKRKQFIPDFDGVLKAAYKAGAIGVALSGAGPSILVLTNRGKERIIAQDLKNILYRNRINYDMLCLEPDLNGIQVQIGNN